MLAEEQKAKAIERETAINEAAPRPQLSGLSVKELQVLLCKHGPNCSLELPMCTVFLLAEREETVPHIS